MLYLSQRPIAPDLIDVEQQKKLNDFKKATESIALWGVFSTSDQLKHQLIRHLTAKIRVLVAPKEYDRSRGLTGRQAPVKQALAAPNYGISFKPPGRKFTKAPITVWARQENPLPPGTELWLFTQGDQSGHTAWWAQNAFTGGKKCSADYYPRDWKHGEKRTLQLFLVGPDGQALIAYFRNVNQLLSLPQNKHWIGITKLTSDMHPIGASFQITLEHPA